MAPLTSRAWLVAMLTVAPLLIVIFPTERSSLTVTVPDEMITSAPAVGTEFVDQFPLEDQFPVPDQVGVPRVTVIVTLAVPEQPFASVAVTV